MEYDFTISGSNSKHYKASDNQSVYFDNIGCTAFPARHIQVSKYSARLKARYDKNIVIVVISFSG